MTCGKCGAELLASAKFCASCGTPTAVPSASSSSQLAAQSNPTPGSSGNASASNLLADAMPAIAQPAQPPSNLLLIDMPEAATQPKSMVNPFAVTASPGKRPSSKPPPGFMGGQQHIGPISDPKIEAKVDSVAPKSAEPPPPSPRAVSPLAMSNGVSGPTPFQQALEKARQSVAPSAPGAPASSSTPLSGAGAPAPEKKAAKKPGTYVMATAPLRPGKTPGSEPPPSDQKLPEEPPKKKAVPKTVAMHPIPQSARSGPRSQVAPGSVAPQMPQSVGAPPSVGMPGSFVAPSGPQMPPQQPPQQAQQWGQTPQPHSQAYQPHPVAQPLAPYQPAPAPHSPAPQWGQAPAGYPVYQQPPPPPAFGPGARVQVKWSNGQRYPATVNQVNGQQVLVIFPDGQQHWVDMQYLAPG